LNYEDPEVFERLTGPDFEKHMKATYGYDHVMKIEQTIMVNNVKVVESNDLPMRKHCAESENR
jgi:hypothetical protein